ncbi:hypothetical protein BGX29_007063 [Mortierella sp. GBA35]|nr:hypothetical protein BGX29_007063 [Mortierella sp. GBA35]
MPHPTLQNRNLHPRLGRFRNIELVQLHMRTVHDRLDDFGEEDKVGDGDWDPEKDDE